MGRALADAFPEARAVFDEVDFALGEKLSTTIFDGPIEIECRYLVVECGSDVGLAHSLNLMRTRRKDGRAVDFWMRSTLGFRRIDGSWTISHGHSSVPFAMDGSFRALLDLTP